MAVTSTRLTTITFSGDYSASLAFSAASNATSPGSVDIYTLASGANTITLPVASVANVVKGATIIPPSGNTQTITLKGVTGDTGVALHKTDPTSIAFDTTPPVSFVLTAGGAIVGLRIVWS